MSDFTKQKVLVVGAGPVGALAALYAAGRGDDVEVYELRSGMVFIFSSVPLALSRVSDLCYALCCSWDDCEYGYQIRFQKHLRDTVEQNHD